MAARGAIRPRATAENQTWLDRRMLELRIAVSVLMPLYFRPMEKKKVTRWQASGLHLLISIAIAAAVLALMLSLWYPGPLFEAAGGNDLLFILVAVDVVVGPLITLVIFRSGKRGLKFDLAVIGVLQIGALVYGMHAAYLARPVFIVFVVDQFQVASALQLDPEELAKAKYPEFRQAPLGGPSCRALAT